MSTGPIRRALAAVLAVAVAPALAPGQNPNRPDDPGGAAQYFEMIRAFPGASIPSGARQAAIAEMRARWPRASGQRDALIAPTPNGLSTTWVALGPSPLTNASGVSTSSGRLNSIAIDPNNSQRIFVGGAQGGVWITPNAGSTWTPLTDSQCSLAMGSVAIDPNNSNTIYAGTGELNNSGDSYYGCGVLKSTDGGNTWTQLGASTFVKIGARSATISKIVVDRTPGTGIVLAASSLGLFRSADGGSSWTLVIASNGAGDVASDVIQDPVTTSTYYAAQGNANGSTLNGIYKSTDAGVTWARLSGVSPNALPTTGLGRINLAATAAAPGTVYAAIQNAAQASYGALLGLYVTADGGATWSQRSATLSTGNSSIMCSLQCWYSMVVAADQTNSTTVYFGGLSLYKSVDGGNTFTDLGTSGVLHVDQHAFAFDPTTASTIYSGNDGGIFKSTDAGSTWTSLNTGLSLTQFYAGVSVSPTSATVILGGTQDNGTLQWGGVPNWPGVIGGDGGFTALDPLTGGTAFGETQWAAGGTNSGGPRRRDPPGSSFNPKIAGLSLLENAAFIPPMVMDPFHPRILYFGATNLYRTGNSGDLWSSAGIGLVNTPGTQRGVINAIGIAPSDSMTVYVGSADARVSYTHDMGGTWSTVQGILPQLAVTDFAVDSRDARTAVITFGGFGPSHVWQTSDGGATWSNLTFDLPNIPVLAAVLEPGSRDIDIGTDLGVFTLRNGASSWSPLVNGLPNVAVYDLVFDTQRSRLIAATHGRGMFSIDVTPPPVLRGDITNDGKVGVADAQAILASIVGLPIPAGSIRYPNGDANCDGQVTALDALIVLMKAASISTGTCVGTIR